MMMIIAIRPIIAATMPAIVPVEPRLIEAKERMDQDFSEEKMEERDEMIKGGWTSAHAAWLQGWGCTEWTGSCWLRCRCSIPRFLWRCWTETRCRPLQDKKEWNQRASFLHTSNYKIVWFVWRRLPLLSVGFSRVRTRGTFCTSRLSHL